LAGAGSSARPRATMIVFIPCSGDESKPCGYDSDWLPRQCPVCRQFAIIGHGRRWRFGHDQTQVRMRVRRGLCNHCEATLTVLPPESIPRSSYNLRARQQAMDRLTAGLSMEQAAPDCLDADRVAAGSTIRRWAWRRIESLWVGATLGWNFWAPTIVAWDWRAALRILCAEPTPS
jgi:hypothetical protein